MKRYKICAESTKELLLSIDEIRISIIEEEHRNRIFRSDQSLICNIISGPEETEFGPMYEVELERP